MTDTISGYTIARIEGVGDRGERVKGYTLTDPEGAYLMIDSFGCVAPTYRSAVLERERRIEDCQYCNDGTCTALEDES